MRGQVEFAAVLVDGVVRDLALSYRYNMAALHGDYLRRALPLSRQLLNAVFGQDVRRFQKDIPRRGYDAARPKRKATRDHPEYPREFLFAAHNLGRARERPCVNRRHGL